MLGDSPLNKKALAALCHRLSTALSAGIDVRSVWAREAEAAHGRSRDKLARIAEAIARGSSVSDAVASTGNFFPILFREMVTVGEQSGHLSEVLRKLAENYDHELQMRRVMWGAMTLPLAQFAFTLFVVGFLIWVVGAIASFNNSKPLDLLGLGLVGTRGLVVYLAFGAVVGVAVFLVALSIRRGLLWTAPLQRALVRIPLLGPALEKLALARLSWALHVTMETGMDLRRALQLSLQSTHNIRYTEHANQVLASIRAGREIHEAFAQTRAYPREFLDAVAVGEQSGLLAESLARLSQQYQEEAQTSLKATAVLAGFLVWALVAVVIIMLIFRIFGSYINVLNEAGRM